jgi:polysaccharide biosynthesis protein PslF
MAISEHLAGVDLGVLPFNHGVTLKSGSLLALMAHALPIVATRATPLDPDLEEEHLIRLVPPRNQQELAAALIQLLADSSLRNQLGSAGYRFSRQFAWSNIADAHLCVYQSALKNRFISVSA